MTYYSHTTSFDRGEVAEGLYDRADADFYKSASAKIDNWLPDVAGGLERRPAFALVGNTTQFFDIVPSALTLSDASNVDVTTKTFLFQDAEFILVFRKIFEAGFETVTCSCFRVDPTGVTQQFDEYLVYYSLASTSLPAGISNTLPDSVDGQVPRGFSNNISENICITQVGPSVFLTSLLFPPYRVFVDDDNDASIELVEWFEELIGTVEIEKNSNEWKGTDSIFRDQLSNGDKFYFEEEEFTVQSIALDPNDPDVEIITSTANYTGITLAGRRIQIKTDEFEFDWPKLSTFFSGRLFLFASKDKPVGMWASKANSPFIIIPGSVYEDSPIEVELFTSGAEGFNWVEAADRIILGGGQAEYAVQGFDGGTITPTTFTFFKVSSIGGAAIQPFSNDSVTVFVNRGRTRVNGVRFDDSRAGFVADDISLLAPHLLTNRVKEITFRPSTSTDRAPRIFVLTDAGEVRTCAFSQEQNFVAWSRISLPEGYEVRSLTTTPTQVYALIALPESEDLLFTRLDVDSEEFFLIDFAKKYTLVDGVTQITAEHQGNANSLVVLDDFRFLGFFSPTGTTLDIGDEDFNGEVTVGIVFNSELEMLPVAELQFGDGGTLNRKHRLVRVLVSVEEAYQLSVNGEPMFGTLTTNDTTGFPKRSGTFERRFFGWSERPKTEIESSSVYPAKIRSVTREVRT